MPIRDFQRVLVCEMKIKKIFIASIIGVLVLTGCTERGSKYEVLVFLEPAENSVSISISSVPLTQETFDAIVKKIWSKAPAMEWQIHVHKDVRR